uniref:Autophagy protein 5 n=1 Tax=Alona affinis TaxID=381656 RepID=A0A9N6ZEY3_9CRUS|nr:EOG090X0BB3 [Alona affinis]
MAEDREILREIWGGRLPICFTLASEEVSTPMAPDPFYLMVPRMTYFPLVTEKVRRHFVRCVVPEKQDNEMWLEFEKHPLKWHYPVGLLYDLFVTDMALPWQVVVHFDKIPESKIMKCPSKDVVESHLMSSLKEADALKHKSHIMSLMQERDHNQLWLGLLHDKFDQFWSVNRKLMEHSDEDGFRHIPFRLYVPDLTTKPFIQFLMKPVENEKRNTLEDLLHKANLKLESKGAFQVIIHGIDMPLETPLQWLSEHLSYPDNFLHLCIRYPLT